MNDVKVLVPRTSVGEFDLGIHGGLDKRVRLQMAGRAAQEVQSWYEASLPLSSANSQGRVENASSGLVSPAMARHAPAADRRAHGIPGRGGGRIVGSGKIIAEKDEP